MPQKPLTPEILKVAENVMKDLPPGVLRADLVTTADGEWAIEVGLANREFPVPEIDEAAGSQMVARPAYPKG